MNLTKQEKELIKYLIKGHLDNFEKEGTAILDQSPIIFSAEKKYDIFLKNLLKKFK